MRLFKRKKKPNRFVELLVHQAEYTVQGMEVLKQYVKEPDDALAEQLSQISRRRTKFAEF